MAQDDGDELLRGERDRIDKVWLLKRLFEGYVRNYGALRCHRVGSGWADSTQNEISQFAQLGLMLGYVPTREHCEDREDHPRKTNQRDLCWLDVDNRRAGSRGRVFLHLERETEREKALDTVNNPNNKLLESASFADGRLLVGVFGWVTEKELAAIRKAVEDQVQYEKASTLLIAWVSAKKDVLPENYSIRGLVYTDRRWHERRAVAGLERGEEPGGSFWYLYFGADSRWGAQVP